MIMGAKKAFMRFSCWTNSRFRRRGPDVKPVHDLFGFIGDKGGRRPFEGGHGLFRLRRGLRGFDRRGDDHPEARPCRSREQRRKYRYGYSPLRKETPTLPKAGTAKAVRRMTA